ncbi:MAG TPA: 4-hydroxythreonine-4-phosphate dehydrogenase PdxA, partial [Nitrospiria bacterium]|nr:4-hydroxythreonine-4-phosphate dehydrogenase PdxA [Nitrospiria bacterium]
FSGHTEYLAEAFGTGNVGMLMVVPPEPKKHGGLRVLLSTTHVAIKDLPPLLTVERITQTILLGYHACRERLGLAQPRIGVAGLNPHGGEEGLFGKEEKTVIRPAVEKALGEGIPVTGPWPADTLFRRAVDGEFDLVIALYHDQALIPVKLLGFHRSVNVTIGLPIIRTSVDHGTAYDIAGKGTADPGSLIEAIRLAADLSRIS